MNQNSTTSSANIARLEIETVNTIDSSIFCTALINFVNRIRGVWIYHWHVWKKKQIEPCWIIYWLIMPGHTILYWPKPNCIERSNQLNKLWIVVRIVVWIGFGPASSDKSDRICPVQINLLFECGNLIFLVCRKIESGINLWNKSYPVNFAFFKIRIQYPWKIE
jgi:hypothetical protein